MSGFDILVMDRLEEVTSAVAFVGLRVAMASGGNFLLTPLKRLYWKVLRDPARMGKTNERPTAE